MKLALLSTSLGINFFISFAQPEILRNTVQSNYFQSITSGMNAIYQGEKTRGGFDLSVQTCHFFLITGRRIKNDSLYKQALDNKVNIREVFKGFSFLVNYCLSKLNGPRLQFGVILTALN